MSDESEKNVDLADQLKRKADIVDGEIASILKSERGIEPQLKAAMAYAVQSPGKRLRAAITLWACEIVSGAMTGPSLVAAAAVEMVHTYSLVHDDLPAMDDDDLRRGQPSCHKAFDEATAILAGDGLLTLAFEIVSCRIEDKSMAAEMAAVLSKAAGPSGMIAGQMADMKSGSAQGDIELLRYIHTNKTAKMFAAAAMMGVISAGGSEEQLSNMENYGINLGICFQIVDDILDVTASSGQLGKTAGKDADQEKITYVSLVGIDESRRLADEYAEKAINSLGAFGTEADILRQLASELLNRTK